MKFLFIERVIYSDGVRSVYEHVIEANSRDEAKEKANSKFKETKKLIGRDGRCYFVGLRSMK